MRGSSRRATSQPGSSHTPVALDCSLRDVQDVANLGFTQTKEVAHLHDCGLPRVYRAEPLQEAINFQDSLRVLMKPGVPILKLNGEGSASSFVGTAAAGVIDQDLAHQLSR